MQREISGIGEIYSGNKRLGTAKYELKEQSKDLSVQAGGTTTKVAGLSDMDGFLIPEGAALLSALNQQDQQVLSLVLAGGDTWPFRVARIEFASGKVFVCGE